MASYFDDPEVMSTATPSSLADTAAQNRDVLRSQYPEQAAVLDNTSPLATPAPQSAAEAIKQAQTQFQSQAQQEQQQIAGQRAQLAEMVKGVLDQYKDGAEKGKWGVKILDDTIGKGGMGISPAKAALFAVGTVLGAQQRNGSGLATGMKLMQLPDQWEKQKSDMAHQVIQDAMGSLNLQSNLDTRQEALTTKQTGNWAKSLTQILAQRTGPGKEFATVDDWPEQFKAIAIQSGTMRPEMFQKRETVDTTNGQVIRRDAQGNYSATPIEGAVAKPQAMTKETEDLLLARAANNLPLSPAHLAMLGAKDQVEGTMVLKGIRMNRMAEYEQQRKIAAEATAANRQERLAPRGTYLNPNGSVKDVVYEGDMQGTKFLPQGSPREKVFNASNLLHSHIDQTLEHIGALSVVDGNKLKAWLPNELKKLKNNPDAVILLQYLDAVTPLAAASAYASQSAGMRAGIRMAETISKGVSIKPEDSLLTALNKVKTMAELNINNVRDLNLPTERFTQQLNTINGLIAKAQSGGATPVPGRIVR